MRWSDLVEEIGTKMPDRLVRTQKRMLPNVPNQEKLVNGKEHLRVGRSNTNLCQIKKTSSNFGQRKSPKKILGWLLQTY